MSSPASWRKYKPRFREYVVCYLLWAVLLVMGYVTVFMVWRQAIVYVLSATMQDSYSNRFLYMMSMILLSVGLFIGVFVSEVYLRNGIGCRQLRRRFLSMAAPLAIACIGGLLLQSWALSQI